MPAGIRKQLAADMAAHGYSQIQELWQDLALSWISKSQDEQARRLLKPDAPAFRKSPRIARQLAKAAKAEIKRDPGDETISHGK